MSSYVISRKNIKHLFCQVLRMAEGGQPELETQKKLFQDFLKQSLQKDESW